MSKLSARTSESHPLIINTLAVLNGELGLTFCPGKKQAHALTGAWHRSVAADLGVVRSWGAQVVISLLEDFEYDELQVDELRNLYPAYFRWLNLPIPDKCAPDAAWLARWLDLRDDLSRQLAQGAKILIHCKGGFGRTGTVAALLLIDQGHSAEEAISLARQAREFAVETAAQLDFVKRYAAMWCT